MFAEIVIVLFQVSDAGEYLCQVATGQDPIPSLVHTVSVRQQGELGEATQASTLKSNASSSTFSLLLFLLLPLLLVRP